MRGLSFDVALAHVTFRGEGIVQRLSGISFDTLMWRSMFCSEGTFV